MKKNSKKKNKLNRIRILFAIAVVLLVALTIIIGIIFTNKKDSKGDTFEQKEVTLNFESRRNKLDTFDAGEYDKYGWIQVQGTNIDVPILSFDAAYTDIEYSFSVLSEMYNSGDNRKVIMGHNVLNISNQPLRPNKELRDFEELMAFTYQDFAKENNYVQLTDFDSEDIYVIYAIGFYDYGEDRAESLKQEKVSKYIKNAKKKSIYDYDVDVNENDQLISLKTCTRYFGRNEKQTMIIDLRKVRENEKITNHNVKTSDNYNELIEINEKM